MQQLTKEADVILAGVLDGVVQDEAAWHTSFALLQLTAWGCGGKNSSKVTPQIHSRQKFSKNDLSDTYRLAWWSCQQ